MIYSSWLWLIHFNNKQIFPADMFLTWGSWCGRWHRNTRHTRLGSSAPHLPAGWRRSLWYYVYRCRSGRAGTWLWPVSLNTPQRTGFHWGPGRWRGTLRRACAYGPSPFLHHLLWRWVHTKAQMQGAAGNLPSPGKPSAWCCPSAVLTCLMNGRKGLVVVKFEFKFSSFDFIIHNIMVMIALSATSF